MPSHMHQGRRKHKAETQAPHLNSVQCRYQPRFHDFSAQLLTTCEEVIILCLICAKSHLKHLLFCPPSLCIADFVLKTVVDVPNYQFWLIINFAQNHLIHLVGNESGCNVTVSLSNNS